MNIDQGHGPNWVTIDWILFVMVQNASINFDLIIRVDFLHLVKEASSRTFSQDTFKAFCS